MAILKKRKKKRRLTNKPPVYLWEKFSNRKWQIKRLKLKQKSAIFPTDHENNRRRQPVSSIELHVFDRRCVKKLRNEDGDDVGSGDDLSWIWPILWYITTATESSGLLGIFHSLDSLCGGKNNLFPVRKLNWQQDSKPSLEIYFLTESPGILTSFKGGGVLFKKQPNG